MPVTGKTFEELKAKIADWLGMRESDTQRLPDSVRGDIINIKQRELLRKYDFRFCETSATLTITTAKYSTLPTDFARPLTMQIQDGTSTPVFLEQLLPEEYDVRYPEDSAGTGATIPKYYAIYGNKIYWGPKPDKSYTTNTLKYYCYLVDLVNGAPNNTNDLIFYAWDVLLWECLSEASLYGIEDPRVPIFKAKAAEALQTLIIEHTRSRSAGRRPIAAVPGAVAGA